MSTQTARIEEGNYLIIGNIIDGSVTEFMGKILTIRPAGDSHQVRIQTLLDLSSNLVLDTIISMSAEALQSTERIRIFDENEGEATYRSLLDNIREHNRQRPVVSLAPARESDNNENIDDEPVTVIHPSTVDAEVEDVSIASNIYDVNLDSGNMKTILKIAEKNPGKIFSVVDDAIKKSGHIVLDYLKNSDIFIELKIEDVKSFETVTLEKNSYYYLKKEDITVDAKYLGNNHWLIANLNRNINNFSGHLMIFSAISYRDMRLEKIDQVSSEMMASYTELSKRIDSYILEECAASDEVPVSVVREKNIVQITGADFGPKWVDALTYYYILGGKFDHIDANDMLISTFSTASSIERVAAARKDKHVLKMLSTELLDQVENDA